MLNRATLVWATAGLLLVGTAPHPLGATEYSTVVAPTPPGRVPRGSRGGRISSTGARISGSSTRNRTRTEDASHAHVCRRCIAAELMAARWRAPSRCEEGVIRHKRAPVAFFVHPHSQPAPLRLINSCQCIFLGPSAQGDNPCSSSSPLSRFSFLSL